MLNISISFNNRIFKSVKEAMEELGCQFREQNQHSVLVWTDSIRDADYFSNLNPWQVVNRIPCAHVLCRKASLTRCIQQIAEYFPQLYNFYPKSYILPFKNSAFLRALKRTKCAWIIKPDSGSLGQGITILNPGSEYPPDESLSVAQEYVDSFLLNNTKFDLRIYALVTSVDPLTIYIYRDGLARFCSEATGHHSVFSQITNVTLNKQNPELDKFEEISRLISDTFPRLEKECNADIKKLWSEIDNIIVLSIMSAHRYLKTAVQRDCAPSIISRCFQIFGFDILLDRELHPHVIEVNYRPNLEYHRGPERRMKVTMIRDAIAIAAPLESLQAAVEVRPYGWDAASWKAFLLNNPTIINQIEQSRKRAIELSKYELIYPSTGDKQKVYQSVLNKIDQLKADVLPGTLISTEKDD
ncbi:Tubulin-tyrosine ligase family protein [Trichomonas vaginalis G3]|uniref:Tubulin-tyrosine ligase family protein n=1 Tax=Trichomonas vaginalis (strain ATCC PRA-98 / G3) TaxID=412133 RepID=A2EL00_TRIV3|nr:positive regulation of cilium movement [Trichomonas vaginalis G3]EAY06708.1 Tubulin-tyrosine ligase family protein [Trichomonas vaginalis G3]KAI5491676.1 positive regulation of cilium movement [Trichomonas vaginalis G3]|eukprot:XP_001318931.1 Tubulin-tyrosine ligase family protein [Trichomonas vaginalis G3]